jgi:hypothetical protein
MTVKRNRSRRVPRPMTEQEKREDARDVAIIRREIAKGGPTIGHNQLMRELGFHDLVIPALGRR